MMEHENFSKAEIFIKEMQKRKDNQSDERKININKTIEKENLNDSSFEFDIWFSIVITIATGIGVLLILVLAVDLNFFLSLIIAGLFTYSHPYIGKFYYKIIFNLKSRYRKVFNLDIKNSSEKSNKIEKISLPDVALLPFVGVFIIVFYLIGILFGKIYKQIERTLANNI